MDTTNHARRKMATILRSIVLNNSGWSVTEAAIRLRVGRPALSNLLNGNASLSVEMAVRIEDVCRYKAVSLLYMQIDYELEDYRRTVGSVILPSRGCYP